MYASHSPVRYRISYPVSAVKLEEHPGSSLRSPTTTLVDIPPGAVIELEGRAAASGLVNVLWNGNPFSVFYEDLREKAELVTSQITPPEA